VPAAGHHRVNSLTLEEGHYRNCDVDGPTISDEGGDKLPGKHLTPPAQGVSLSKLTCTDCLDFNTLPRPGYFLIARMSGRSRVHFDIGRGVRDCDIRHGHILLFSAQVGSCWWIEHPEQTVILNISTEMLQSAWEQDTKEIWPGVAEMCSFRQDAQVIQIMTNLTSELDRSDQINSAYTKSLVLQFSTHLVRRYSQSTGSAIKHSGMSPNRLNKVLDYIAAGLEEELRLAEIADVAGISPYYFCREFKKTMGITPYGYILQQRIDRAKALLQSTSMSITDIGAQLLFQTPSHFTATFRKVVGLTPSVFRLRC
jgi:AraC family transcriptional regulator